MRRLVLALALLLGVMGQGQSAWAQSGVGGGGQSNVGGGSGSGTTGSATSPAGPVMGFYLTNACPSSNTGQCFFTSADTQEQNICSWSAAATTVTCTLSSQGGTSAAVAANVATYTVSATIGNGNLNVFGGYAVGDSITVTGFTGADTFFNQTCTLTAVTPTTVSCALVHANASSSTTGTVANTTGGPFVAGDVGKQAQGWATCLADLASAAYGLPIITGATAVTISSFISKTQVSLSQNPANAVASNGCFIWGHSDDTGASAVDAAMQVIPQCPKLFLAASNYLLQSPHFFTQPYGCTQLGSLFNSTHGNVTLPVGFEVEGRGVGPTNLFLASNFPNGDTCQHPSGPTADAVKGCFAIPLMGKWTDFSINGGGNMAGATFSGNPNLIAMQIATLQNFLCENVGGYTGVHAGIEFGVISNMYQVNNSGCGQIGIEQGASGGESNWVRVVVESSKTNALSLNSGDLTCYWCVFAMARTSISTNVISNAGSKFRWFGGYALPDNFFPTTNTGITLYSGGATSNLFADSVSFDIGTSVNGGIGISGAGGVITLVNGNINTPNGTFGYGDSVGGTLYLDSSTKFTLPFLAGTIAGSIVADGHSLTAACTGVGTAASTLGLRISGTSTAGTGIPTTCISTTIDAGLPMTGSRTVSTMLVNATAAGTNASSGVVTILKNGVATAITCTVGVATSCNDFSHSAAFVKGDLLSAQFTTQAADTLAGVKVQILWQ